MSWKPPGRREAGNHLLGLTVVKYPAVPTLKPLRTTERRIFIASSSMILRRAYAFSRADSSCEKEQPQVLRLRPLRRPSLRWDEKEAYLPNTCSRHRDCLGGRYAMKTHVGVDLHQRFCYLTAVDASGKTRKQGQVVNEGEALRAWLRQLPGPGQVVVEASGFCPAFARAVGAESERLVMVHPQRVKAIASAKLKNDRVDSETLAHLSRCDLLPTAWMADEATQQLRLRVRLRITLGRQRARAKNQLQAVLHQEGFKKPVTDVFGKRGRAWLAGVGVGAGD